MYDQVQGRYVESACGRPRDNKPDRGRCRRYGGNRRRAWSRCCSGLGGRPHTLVHCVTCITWQTKGKKILKCSRAHCWLQVDELLDWTTGLNFDEYWTGWKAIATSQSSDNISEWSSLIPVVYALVLAPCLTWANSANVFTENSERFNATDDPFELSISHQPSASRQKTATRQSQNTPNSMHSAKTPTTKTTTTKSATTKSATTSSASFISADWKHCWRSRIPGNVTPHCTVSLAIITHADADDYWYSIII